MWLTSEIFSHCRSKMMSAIFPVTSFCSYTLLNFDTRSVDISFHKTGHNFKTDVNFKIDQHHFQKEASYNIHGFSAAQLIKECSKTNLKCWPFTEIKFYWGDGKPFLSLMSSGVRVNDELTDIRQHLVTTFENDNLYLTGILHNWQENPEEAESLQDCIQTFHISGANMSVALNYFD